MKKTIIAIVVIILLGAGIYFITWSSNTKLMQKENVSTVTPTPSPTVAIPVPANKDMTVIGKSVEGRDILAYHFGTGDTKLLFIGGIHGGYEWNTALVAYELRDFLKENPDVIPQNVEVTVIPVLNPDGLSKVVGTTTSPFAKADVSTSQTTLVSGRFNAHTVDLNRNFDCDWQASAKWQNKTVSGGSEAFSEPESQAIRDYVELYKPNAVVVWYSAAGGVYASSCHNGVSSDTSALTDMYSKASGYPAHENFDFYEITGDMVNWLAKKNIPAISVLLTNHEDVEWIDNKAGILAVLKSYSK
ncbi:MAG: M14 family zinc carboxypeptidase [Candidatus Taylorbacteria bacterium]